MSRSYKDEDKGHSSRGDYTDRERERDRERREEERRRDHRDGQQGRGQESSGIHIRVPLDRFGGRGRNTGQRRASPPPDRRNIGRGRGHARREDDGQREMVREQEVEPGERDDGQGDMRQRQEGSGHGARRGQRADRNERFDLVRSRPNFVESKKGTSGKSTWLIANYFILKKQPTWCLFNYHVTFTPHEETNPVRKALLKVHTNTLGSFIFDGTNMWTAHRLQPEPMILYSAREPDDKKFEVCIRLVSQVAPGDVSYLQFYNIIVRKCLQALKFEEIGRHFYDRNAAITMSHRRMELWPGYITSMRNHENDIMLCVEVTHKVLRLDTCLQAMQGHAGNPDYRRSVMEDLIGNVVMTSYNRKTYKIDDIDWNTRPIDSFDLKGVRTSFQDYYKDRYGIDIQHTHQPMLVSQPKKRALHRGDIKPILLVPELCVMTGLSEKMRNNFSLMKELALYLHQLPHNRILNIQNFMRRIMRSQPISEELRKWGLEFDGHLVRIPGRILPKEHVLMLTGRQVQQVVPDEKSDWGHAFKNKEMFANMPMKRWVAFVPQRDVTNFQNFLSTMVRVGKTLKFDLGQPLEITPIRSGSVQEYVEAINRVYAAREERLDLLFFVLPTNKLDLYAAIKKRCCIEFGIPSQCYLAKNLVNPRVLMSFATKVVIQMNAKLGGQPWVVANPLRASHTMIVGFDVYHCSKRKGASVGAMVATTNKEFSRYYSCVSFYRNRNEISTSLCQDMTKCLSAFRAVNNELPERVIMFRDGVGGGHLTYVYNVELEQIKSALQRVYNDAGRSYPKFTLIIVTKKINTRLVTIPTTKEQSSNPAPGTIVDDVITLPERWDFYLISQHVNQGTVSPTSYNVLCDQQGLDPDKIQRFTYKMTHMYFNWSGTVAVPAPCQYAHKLAYLTGLSLGEASNERLAHLLYYL